MPGGTARTEVLDALNEMEGQTSEEPLDADLTACVTIDLSMFGYPLTVHCNLCLKPTGDERRVSKADVTAWLMSGCMQAIGAMIERGDSVIRAAQENDAQAALELLEPEMLTATMEEIGDDNDCQCDECRILRARGESPDANWDADEE